MNTIYSSAIHARYMYHLSMGMDFWGQQSLEFALYKWQAQTLPPNNEPIHLRVGFACFFSHSCGTRNVKLREAATGCVCFFPSKTWRCWDSVGAVLLVGFWKRQMVWKFKSPYIWPFRLKEPSPKQSSLNASSVSKKSDGQLLAPSSRYLPGICYLHCVIMWRVPSFGKNHVPWGSCRNTTGFPCGCCEGSVPRSFGFRSYLGKPPTSTNTFWKHSPVISQ